ncbi:MAG TPA: tetratricopeptide repeat protein [Vicinamibacteria bacterium]|nr:tetratricopeptide repeat protein [Vicinamibacteria bacterium]
MLRRSIVPHALSWVAGLLLCGAASAAEVPSDPAAALDAAIAAAETSLREGELQVAESRYRSALLEGWLLMGDLQATEGQLPLARVSYRRASTSAVETRRALRSLALVHLQSGEPAEAVSLLTGVVGRSPEDVQARRMLAKALTAAGQLEQAVQVLEEAHAAAPDDLELTFALASGYLRLKKVEAAEPLFARIANQRPIPQTHVLIGRTYRDFKEYERARVELQAALKQDPSARRAHYYLGTLGLMAEGPARLEEAIAEFRQELKVSPADPLASLRLGIALLESRRPAEALPALDLASRSDPPEAEAFHYLGRAQLALDLTTPAVVSLRRALELIKGPPFDEVQRGSIHYNLALALRKVGASEEAATHFAAAELASAHVAESARERLSRYLSDSLEPEPTAAVDPFMEVPLVGLGAEARSALKQRATTALARAYLNLGVMQAQGEHFSRAAEHFESAAEVAPDFPNVQYSLGVAHFNARAFDKATGPLARALAQSPDDAGLRRMLAVSWLNVEAYDKAAALLKDDPARFSDPSLEYAYGLALVRSGRAAEAEAVFARLLALHGESAELGVVMGQAHAQQGDYESAVETLQAALRRKPDVADANATLGVIYLKQGKLPEAEAALRAELRSNPGDLKSQHHLATVLDLEGRTEEALPLLRAVLKAKPDFADARYLLGKILLAGGAAGEAAEHLEAAARLAPEDANIHYQLGQAYQKLGRTDEAQQQFEIVRQIKDKRRGSTS